MLYYQVQIKLKALEYEFEQKWPICLVYSHSLLDGKLLGSKHVSTYFVKYSFILGLIHI